MYYTIKQTLYNILVHVRHVLIHIKSTTKKLKKLQYTSEENKQQYTSNIQVTLVCLLHRPLKSISRYSSLSKSRIGNPMLRN